MMRSSGIVVAMVVLTAGCGGQVSVPTEGDGAPGQANVVGEPVSGVVTQRQSERLGLAGDSFCSLSALSRRLHTDGLTLKRTLAGFLTDEPGVTQWAAEMFGAWSDASGRPAGQVHALCWFETEGTLDALNDGTEAPARFVVVDATIAAPLAASVLVSSPNPIGMVAPRPPVDVPGVPARELVAANQPVGVKIVAGESGAERSQKVDTQGLLDSLLPGGQIPVH